MFCVNPAQMAVLLALIPPEEGASQILPWLAIPVFLAGGILGALFFWQWNRALKKSASTEAARMKADAEKEIDKMKVEAKLRLTEEIKRKQEELDHEHKEFKKEAAGQAT